MCHVTVLITSMHQSDFSILKKMNVSSNAIIANQDGRNSISVDGNNLLITTNTLGLSRNRNIALAHTDQKDDIVVFADDDLIFNDNYEEVIIGEFQKYPYAEAIKFNIHDLSNERKISMRRISKFGKATRKNMSSSGVCGLAIRQSVIVKNNMHFNEFFGTGTNNYCGEDTIFIQEMINKRVRFYRSPIDVAGIYQKESSWFKGYDHKYFNVCGKVLATCYPKLCRLIAIRSAFKFSKNDKCQFSFFEILKDYFAGIRNIEKS